MIEKLKNCPNCGGTLNEAGRCSFCGSKVYDFLSINFDHTYRPSARTYIRIKSNGKVILAPIIVESVSISLENNNMVYIDPNGHRNYCPMPCYPSFDVTFRAIGDTVQVDEDGGQDNGII